MKDWSWLRQVRNVFYNDVLIKFISYRTEKAGSNYITNSKAAEQKLLQPQTRQKCTGKPLKEPNQDVRTLNKECNNSYSLRSISSWWRGISIRCNSAWNYACVSLKWSSLRKRIFVNESYYKKLFLQKFHNKTSTFESKSL